MLKEAVTDALADTIKLLPFLFLTYLAMEYIEHKMENSWEERVRKFHKYGPVFGGFCGILPQCGLASVASNLYAGKVITLGTLLAVYLATSDEMLPILLSRAVPGLFIVRVLLLKLVVAVLAGVFIDRFVSKERPKQMIHSICEQDHCCCGRKGGIFLSACRHSLSIFLFLLLVTIALNWVILLFGEDALAGFVLNRPLLGEALAGIVGLIPNCAASVVLTELYLEGGMSFAALMSGLFVGAGVGLLVLFRENRSHWKENIKVTALLYGTGVVAGWCITFLQYVASRLI